MFYTVLVVLLMCLQGLTASDDSNVNAKKADRALNEFHEALRELGEAGNQANDLTLEREKKDFLESAARTLCAVVNAWKREISEETLTKQRDVSILNAAKAVCQAPTLGQGLLNAAKSLCNSANGKKREVHSSNELTEELVHQQNRRWFTDSVLDWAVSIFCKVVNKRDARSFEDPAAKRDARSFEYPAADLNLK